MKNFVQPGNVITAIAPSGGVVSGQGLLYGSFFGVCATTQAAGEEVELSLAGVFELPKATPLAIDAADKLYWDNTAKVVNKTASGNSLIGAATELVTSGAATARVRLNGVTI